MHIEIEYSRCEGHGLCEAVAPDLLRLDDDSTPQPVTNVIPEALRSSAEAAVRVCPVAAVTLKS